MMRGDTAPVTTQREQARPARTATHARMTLEERRARRAARGPRRRRKREQGPESAPTTTHVDESAPVEREEAGPAPTPAPEGRKPRQGQRTARMSLEERRAQRPPRRRRRSTTASATGKESSAGPVAASTTEAEPTPSPSRSRRRRVRDETPRAAPEPGPDPIPIRMREIEERIAATQRAADACDEKNRAEDQSFTFDPSDPEHKDALDRAYAHLSGDRMRPDLRQAMWWEISESLQGRARSQEELRAEWGPPPPNDGEGDRIEVHQSAPLISTRSAGEAAAGLDRIRQHALRQLERIEGEERRHDEERLAREEDNQNLRIVRARRKERQRRGGGPWSTPSTNTGTRQCACGSPRRKRPWTNSCHSWPSS